MRKSVLIFSLILIAAITIMLVVRQNFKGSPDYNFITAKLDIKDGNQRIIHPGFRKPSSKDLEIDSLTSVYGFKNVYIGYDTTKQIMQGIHNYNDVIEAYLKLRNGSVWREKYQREVDSLYKVATPEAK